ncbi:MAG: hypothetical protein MI921_24605 [Cytophagales bacterium]|nr:hypothetical protein [Cytophagales bacterium]
MDRGPGHRHKSYLETQDFGEVECNGLIFGSRGEAIVFDTPWIYWERILKKTKQDAIVIATK